MQVNDPQRHPGFKTSAEEAVICYSAPSCAAPCSDRFLRCALKKHFKTEAWGKRFVHHDKSRDSNQRSMRSKS